ncbi:hypothetical protein [Streptomyces sp. SPB4]|uniref:hypothetical protein n=1 Tax=Streptomyces sp. SPB4 TaxID=2940553 RepID=UPI00247496E2|nr:hypothetical protein [Streptomyces sp. SPB4]MDH6537800.1 hypothetical protein [Streptomyces sp. SPB4]
MRLRLTPLEIANAILDEWHEAGIPPVMYWRGCWYECVDNIWYRRPHYWMYEKVAARYGPGARTRRLIAGPLVGLCIQPDTQTIPPLPPLPTGRVNREEF